MTEEHKTSPIFEMVKIRENIYNLLIAVIEGTDVLIVRSQVF